MISRTASVIAALLLLVSNACHAVLPEQGLWWNPAESGRGYGIEIQDDYIFITYYAYGQSGQSTFFTSGGRYNIVTSSASLDLAAYSNGQCFGCAYVGRPTPSLAGNVSVSFSSPMTGQIRFSNGTVVPIQRQLFFGNEPRTNLFGTWHLTSGALGLYFGDMLWIQSVDETIAGGFKGRVVDGSAQRLLVGAPLASGEIAVLVDSSTSYYTYYVFKWNVNRWGGRSWTYLKTSQPTGSGLLFFGSRVLGKKFSEAAGTSTSNGALKDDFEEEAKTDSMFSVRSAISSPANSEGISDGEEILGRVDDYIEMARRLSISLESDG